MGYKRWLLSIDFGTSNTAAAHCDEGGQIAALALSHTGYLIGSSVYVHSRDHIAVGDSAIDEAMREPSGYLPAPKRLVGQPSVIVKRESLPTFVPIAAVLQAVLQRASAAHGGTTPHHIVLTHPEAWSERQIQVLSDAAVAAGVDLSHLSFISEPRAAAYYYSRETPLEPGGRIAVFDFGGGTLDIAVLAASVRSGMRGDGGSAFEVVSARGDNGLGGKNFDALIRKWVDQQLESRNPSLSEHLSTASASTRAALDESIRRAKELLSESPSATIVVSAGAFQETLQITRGEFEELISPIVERAVALTRDTLLDAGVVDAGQLSALYLTGGSARIPLIQNKVGELGRVATLGDPKTVVAQGALLSLESEPRPGAQPMPTPADLMPSWARTSAVDNVASGRQGSGHNVGPARSGDPDPLATRRASHQKSRWLLPTVATIGVVAVVVAVVVLLMGGDNESATPNDDLAASSAAALESTIAGASQRVPATVVTTEQTPVRIESPGAVPALVSDALRSGEFKQCEAGVVAAARNSCPWASAVASRVRAEARFDTDHITFVQTSEEVAQKDPSRDPNLAVACDWDTSAEFYYCRWAGDDSNQHNGRVYVY